MNGNYPRPLMDRRPIAVPNCMQLGVPLPGNPSPHCSPHVSHGDSLAHMPFLVYPTNLESAYYDTYGSMFPYVPFHGHFGIYDCPFEPAFIQKRNERERQRVKCVNEGYTRLRDHLPSAVAEKRLSKVETLRAAIGYIKYLQDLLSRSPTGVGAGVGEVTQEQKDSAQQSSPASKQNCNSDGESKPSSPYCESEEASS
ncbi:achaete-scute homolog 5 [Callorhinchus milii]|uniref:achaete-scute homolog 5 n=1 Tax=Callorhinchus milii TaxID=7868 RepID=UPI0004571636|nr:achaete-scute homolog 5 [Callorhinchus milii]|eukprot:gi/632967160/ref/XP_007899822.1/ PREDICTED: achaete-scute homolog 5 [Callorhinchus milii]